MRTSAPLSLLCLCVASALAGCTQDGYSSNPNDRDTHMRDLHAVAPPPPPSVAPAPVAPPPAPAAPAPSASQ